LSGPELFAAALVELDAALDWARLGALYCDEGGATFFGEADREALREAGLLVAADLGEALAGRGGTSLYVGAAVAELAPMLCEALVLARHVRAVNLPGPEADELNRALAAVEQRVGQRLPRIETGGLGALEPASCDHLWLVSVLNDPDAFPALHDRLYGRTGELATGRGDERTERARAGALLDAALARLAPPALLSTTDEELPLVEPAAQRRGWRLAVPRRARLSPIVGDPIRLCRVRSA